MMNETAFAGMQMQIDRLQRENRVIKWLGGVAILAAGAFMFAGAAAEQTTTFDTVVAKRFVVVGPNRDRRIELSVNGNNAAASILVFARNGKPVVDIGSQGGGRGVAFLNEENGVNIWRMP